MPVIVEQDAPPASTPANRRLLVHADIHVLAQLLQAQVSLVEKLVDLCPR